MPDVRDEFCNYARNKLADNLAQIERCAGLLTDEQLWSRPNDVSNSIANLILHLTGNVRQWIVAGIGGETFDRDRPSEFACRDIRPAAEILPPLRETVSRACQIIESLTAERLAEATAIQGYEVSVTAAVFHVVEHFSLHTGQIVYQTKILTGQDLSLYDPQGKRLDGRDIGTP